MLTRKCGGVAFNYKGNKNLRVLHIPLPRPGDDRQYVVPKGCVIISHNVFKRNNGSFMRLVIDIEREVLCDAPKMPHNWDYRNLMRDPSSARSRGRTSRR